MMKSFKIFTLGCPVNQAEGASLKAILEERGWKPVDGIAELYIINSCAVTARAAAEARRLAARARKENPEAVVVLAGCYPQVYAADLGKKLEHVDLIVGVDDRAFIPDLVEKIKNKGEKKTGPLVMVTPHQKGNPWVDFSITPQLERTRPVLKIQEGCQENCTYCIVRKARGFPRSMPPPQVFARVRELVAKGAKEIVLAGTHLGSYSEGLSLEYQGWNLARLLQALNEIEGKFRIRLSYIEPMNVDEELLQTLAAGKKCCPHLYLPLQSGSDRILQRMGRRYSAGQFAELVQRARELIPNVSVFTDVIAGFPGETEEDHQATMKFVSELRLSRLHVFPYSPRPGTIAAAFAEQVPPDVKTRRVRELYQLGKKLWSDFLAQLVGGQFIVLVEKVDDKGCWVEGYTENNARVRVTNIPPRLMVGIRGEFLKIRVTAAADEFVWGKMVAH